MKAIILLFLVLGTSAVSAQTSVKVVHEYYNDVYKKFNANVVKVLGLVKEKESAKNFSYIRASNNDTVKIDYQTYEDSRIISVQITGKRRDLVDLFAALYDRKVKTNKLLKRSFIKNDEWVRFEANRETNEGKIIIQAIIY